MSILQISVNVKYKKQKRTERKDDDEEEEEGEENEETAEHPFSWLLGLFVRLCSQLRSLLLLLRWDSDT